MMKPGFAAHWWCTNPGFIPERSACSGVGQPGVPYRGTLIRARAEVYRHTAAAVARFRLSARP